LVKVLITGISGFIGSFLAEYLLKKDMDVYGTILEYEQNEIANIKHIIDELHLIECDIRKRGLVEKIIHESKPDVVFHLASQAYVVFSWEDPITTFETNVLGTIYLFEALKRSNVNPVVIMACSSSEYGDTAFLRIPLKETDPLQPLSPYAVSKATQDLLSYQYYKSFGLKTVRARIFGTIGPKKRGDVCADFAEQIAKIEAGISKPVMSVGNLETRRDLTDVRDMIEALYLLSIRGRCGDVYNLCKGQAYKIVDILKKFLEISRVKIEVQPDPQKMRFCDEPIILGENEKIKRECGWLPQIPIERSLQDILDYWRAYFAGGN